MRSGKYPRLQGTAGPNDFRMSLPEASERFGRNREWLRRLISQGRLPAIRLGGQWWVHEEDMVKLGSIPSRVRANREKARQALTIEPASSAAGEITPCETDQPDTNLSKTNTGNER